MVPSNDYDTWGRSRWESRPTDAVRADYPPYDESYHVPPPPPPPDQQQWPSYGPPPHYQYPPHLQARQPVPTYHQPPHEPSRRLGQWTREEEAYAEKVAALFKTGRVPNCPEGLTMRALLADLLNCAPMRVSKKFSGERAIGKCSYKRVQDDLSKEEADLKPLEEAFHRSLRGVGHLKMSLAHTSGLITPIEANRSPHRVDMSTNQAQADQKPMQPPLAFHPAYIQDPRAMAAGYPHYSRSPPSRPLPPSMGRPIESSWAPSPNGGAYPGADPRMMAPPGYLPPPHPGGPSATSASSAPMPNYSRQPMPPHGGPSDDLAASVSMSHNSQTGHPSYTHAPSHDTPYQNGTCDPQSMRPSKMPRYAHSGGPLPPQQSPPPHAPPQHASAYLPPQMPPSNPGQMPPSNDHWVGGYADERQMPDGPPVDPGAVRYD